MNFCIITAADSERPESSSADTGIADSSSAETSATLNSDTYEGLRRRRIATTSPSPPSPEGAPPSHQSGPAAVSPMATKSVRTVIVLKAPNRVVLLQCLILLQQPKTCQVTSSKMVHSLLVQTKCRQKVWVKAKNRF